MTRIINQKDAQDLRRTLDELLSTFLNRTPGSADMPIARRAQEVLGRTRNTVEPTIISQFDVQLRSESNREDCVVKALD